MNFTQHHVSPCAATPAGQEFQRSWKWTARRSWTGEFSGAMFCVATTAIVLLFGLFGFGTYAAATSVRQAETKDAVARIPSPGREPVLGTPGKRTLDSSKSSDTDGPVFSGHLTQISSETGKAVRFWLIVENRSASGLNLPQQCHDLLRLVLLHRHTSVPPE